MLTRLKLSHNRGASTVSLIERQVVALREKSQTLEARLRELIDVARTNDVLSDKIHKLACRLIRARTAPAILDGLETSLREDFGASEWLIVMGSGQDSELAKISSRHLRTVKQGAAELKMFETLLQQCRERHTQEVIDTLSPYCAEIRAVDPGAEQHRLRGDLLLAGGAWEEAEASYKRAVAVAQAQGARLLELRAATSLARLWRDRGRACEARALLASQLASPVEFFALVENLYAFGVRAFGEVGPGGRLTALAELELRRGWLADAEARAAKR